MKRGFGALAMLVAGGLSLSANGVEAATTRALIVGVSGYPSLPENIRLTGPKNDSREVANTLARLGVSAADITVLADGVSGLAEGIPAPGIGTKADILAQLDRLAETSQPGDLVVFYFSGHGSQQGDLDGDEQGGFDEIFLPYDVKSWTGAGVENALIDDELNLRVQAILDKGGDFFGIIDACHSATGFRAVPGETDVRSRRVEPAQLGVPNAGDATENRGLFASQAESKPGRGRAAFFYAAQENEEALEKTPPGGENGENFGVFTYNLLRRLNQTPDLTYRTLHQAVVADIKRNALMATQTPELEGELLDEPVLRLSEAPQRRQWPIFGGKLQAGQLDGINPGTIVALYEDVAAADGSAVAHAVVETAGATKSIVTPVVYPCPDPAADGSCASPPDEAAVKKGRFARIVEPGIDLSIALSEPVRLDPADGHDYSAALAALDAAIKSEPLSARVSVRKAGYDVAVALVDGKLAFSATGGSVDGNGPGSSPRLTLPDNPAAAEATVSAAVNRMARALSLQRLGGGEKAAALGLRSDVMIARSKAPTGGACSADETAYEAKAPAGDAPRFGDCDILSLRLENQGRKPLDVTVLLVGADFSITPVWPTEGSVNRLHSGDVKEFDLLQMEPDPAAASEERLVLIAVPGVGKSRTIFDNLEQEGLRAAPGDEAPETAAARALLATGLNDMQVKATSAPRGIEEEMSIDIRPFYVGNGKGG